MHQFAVVNSESAKLLSPTLEFKRKTIIRCYLDYIQYILNICNCKTPVTHSRMSRQITAGFLIWKIVSDLRIIFYICILVHKDRNIPIVLVASVTDATGPKAVHGKIKLLDFSVKGLQMLGLINIRYSSVSNP